MLHVAVTPVFLNEPGPNSFLARVRYSFIVIKKWTEWMCP